MPFAKCKVYSDGSHFIAIPHTEKPYKPRRKPREDKIVVADEQTETEQDMSEEEEASVSVIQEPFEKGIENDGTEISRNGEKKRIMTKKELFEELYAAYHNLPKDKRKAVIVQKMRPCFDTAEETRYYVGANMDRKRRNLICRRIRMTRKVNLQVFNYFVTFTFSDEKHTEESFQRGLKTCLRNFSNRKKWKYIGVWERSPQKQRLHFHGIFYIPDGTMPGMMLDIKDYNFRSQRRRITHQNTYFNERFGRSDFEEIEGRSVGGAVAYIMKYIEKSGEKLLYSRGLPQFFISDIMEEDVVCPYGEEEQKLLLYDDFSCWDEGEYMGQVCDEVIGRLPKAN